MKKKKVGKPRHGEKLKLKKSISVDPWKYEKIIKDFKNFSIAIDILMADYITRVKK